MPDAPFTGPERLVSVPSLGRSMRLGAPAAGGYGDADALDDALASQRYDDALRYLEMMSDEHSALLAILGEWSVQLASTLAELVGPSAARATGTQDVPEPLSADAARHVASAKAAIAAQDVGQAREHVTAYFEHVRDAHDALVEFINAFVAATAAAHEQSVAERLLQQSFSACSFFELLWLFGKLPPRELAAFLAAHLRAHLSGHARGGGVEIIEDDDKYRLVFDACGSGGAMRRRHQADGTPEFTLQFASAATWMRAREVPPYCSHCAFNELESIRRYGYPRFVTEFDPDPARPCGWTVYKRAAAVPARYYERLGLKPPPSARAGK